MKRLRSPRLILAAGCLVAAVTGALVAAERSSSAMAGAASAFVASPVTTPTAGTGTVWGWCSVSAIPADTSASAAATR